jgi:hypothetical protein
VTKRTIKTLLSKIIDTISDSDIHIVKSFGDRYVFGEVSSQCNIVDNPQARLERILKVSSIAYALSVLCEGTPKSI